MCGILGIYGFDNVGSELIHGLSSLQHRGQDAAGALVFDEAFKIKKGLGLVNQVFTDKHVEYLQGHAGIGHVRYATQGSMNLINAQPFYVNYPFGIAMAHNGNVTNFNELKKTLHDDYHRLIETSNDLELILYTLAAELEKKDLLKISHHEIFDAVATTQQKVQGSYSVISVVANHGFLVFRDPHGLRPLVMGKRETSKGTVYAFASETTCFDYLGYETVRDLLPGETVFIDAKTRQVHCRVTAKVTKPAFCVFEYIYFAREDSLFNEKLVATEREIMGHKLARHFKEKNLKPDIVIDIPSSSYFFAAGLAEELKVPYRRALSKNNHVGRSFICPTHDERERVVRQKLNPIRDIIKDKKIAVVDDSIVRGTTSKHLVQLLRERGAKEVYFVSASPPITHPCVYGVDMSIKQELLASNNSIEEIKNYIGADEMIYQSLEDLMEIYKDQPCCFACFSGNYPTGVSLENLEQIEKERVCSKKT